jgi:hypothetical protein
MSNEMTHEEALTALRTIIKCLKRSTPSDEVRTALPLAEKLLAAATPPPEFYKRADAEEVKVVQTVPAAEQTASETEEEKK